MRDVVTGIGTATFSVTLSRCISHSLHTTEEALSDFTASVLDHLLVTLWSHFLYTTHTHSHYRLDVEDFEEASSKGVVAEDKAGNMLIHAIEAPLVNGGKVGHCWSEVGMKGERGG
jgi:hypothetical protein